MSAAAGAIVRRVAGLVFWALAALFLGECLSRLIHLNARPMIPFMLDDSGVPQLPRSIDIDVKTPQHSRVRYVTDASGARVTGSECASVGSPVLVVGDSQVLGWSMDFDSTFAARLAGSSAARIVASAATDPELSVPRLRQYRAIHPERHALAILAVNLGNDLDEMYFGRRTVVVPALGGVPAWLSRHSSLFLDVVVLQRALLGEPFGTPPGTNPALFALDAAERAVLGDRITDRVIEEAREVGPADQLVVLLIPNDTTVDPREFLKYQPFYRDPQEFAGWEGLISESGARAMELADRISRRLRREGIAVVDVTSALKAAGPAASLFDRASHHLTARGHAVIARTIAASLR